MRIAKLFDRPAAVPFRRIDEYYAAEVAHDFSPLTEWLAWNEARS